MKNGYYMNISGNEFFFVTSQTRLTKKLLDKMLIAFGDTLPEGSNVKENTKTESGRDLLRPDIKWRLARAVYELKTYTYKGDISFPDVKPGDTITYENIHGENFSGYGSDNIAKKQTTLLYV